LPVLYIKQALDRNKTHNSINAVASISGTAITLLHVSRNEYGMYNLGCDGKRRRPEEDIVRPRVQWAAKAPTGVQGQHHNGRLLQFVSVDCNPIIRYHFQDLPNLTPP